jgi:hypothetical protein
VEVGKEGRRRLGRRSVPEYMNQAGLDTARAERVAVPVAIVVGYLLHASFFDCASWVVTVTLLG